MTPLTLIDRMSTGPARLMKLPAGILEVGRRADITIIDPNESWTVNPQEFKSKSKNCPFKGMFLKGRAKQVFSAGRCLLGEAWMPNPQPEKNLVTAS
jgi:dihydroorotase